MSEWISVKERFPSDEYFGERVIVYQYVWVGFHYDFRIGFVHWYGKPTSDIWQRVTHWMPLPEPPGEEGDRGDL